MSTERLAVGIDFGTTNSCVAIVRDRLPRVLPNAEGLQTTPSVVAYRSVGSQLVGVGAKRQALANPRRTIGSIKRFIGRTAADIAEDRDLAHYELVGEGEQAVKVKIDDELVAPEQIAGYIFTKLKMDAEAFLGKTVKDAVVAVPAYFSERQRQAVRDSARIAGLNVVRLLNEPTAAALAYGFETTEGEKRRVVVLDLGGGTFDVSVLEIDDRLFTVKATAGDNRLGGDDFDEAVVSWMTEQIHNESGIDVTADTAILQRLFDAAERAKIELTSAPETEISLPFLFATEQGPVHFQHELTRAQLEILCKPLLARLEDPIENAIAAAGLDRSQIDDVILIGGMTKMPAVQKKAETLIGKTPHRGVNPDEAVALGAALHASMHNGEIEDVQLIDVTPLSLGVEIASGFSVKLIGANSQLPASAREIFTTAQRNQKSVEVRVLQGERELAAGNRPLGKLQLKGIPAAKAGEPQIEVKFTLDVNGLLQVSARDLATGKARRATLNGVTALSQAEIKQMTEEAARYADDDRRRRELAEMRNELQTMQSQVAEVAEAGSEDAGALLEELIRLESDLLQGLENFDERKEELLAALTDALAKRGQQA